MTQTLGDIAAMTFVPDFSPLLPYWPTFLKGAWLTLKMTSVAVCFG